MGYGLIVMKDRSIGMERDLEGQKIVERRERRRRHAIWKWNDEGSSNPLSQYPFELGLQSDL